VWISATCFEKNNKPGDWLEFTNRHNVIISKDDWRIAYRDVLGKNFDHSLDNTRYLSMNQLQRIIDYANSRSSSR
jgi:hypothetical protein